MKPNEARWTSSLKYLPRVNRYPHFLNKKKVTSSAFYKICREST